MSEHVYFIDSDLTIFLTLKNCTLTTLLLRNNTDLETKWKIFLLKENVRKLKKLLRLMMRATIFGSNGRLWRNRRRMWRMQGMCMSKLLLRCLDRRQRRTGEGMCWCGCCMRVLRRIIRRQRGLRRCIGIWLKLFLIKSSRFRKFGSRKRTFWWDKVIFQRWGSTWGSV